MNAAEINPFDSFATRLRLAEKRTRRPTAGANAGVCEAKADAAEAPSRAIRLRLRFRPKDGPGGGEPYEILSSRQREVGVLDAQGEARIALPADAQNVRISVGAKDRIKLDVSLVREG